MKNNTAPRAVGLTECAEIIDDSLWVQPRSLPDLMLFTGASADVFAKTIREMLHSRRVVWFGYGEGNESLWALVAERVLLALREGARSVRDLHEHFLDTPAFSPDVDAVSEAIEYLIRYELINTDLEPVGI